MQHDSDAHLLLCFPVHVHSGLDGHLMTGMQAITDTSDVSPASAAAQCSVCHGERGWGLPAALCYLGSCKRVMLSPLH